MSVYLPHKCDYVKFYLSLWFVAFLAVWAKMFDSMVNPFRITTISFFLLLLIPLLGLYYILYPLLKSVPFTAEKARLLSFLPAALLILHWLFQQIYNIFEKDGGLRQFSFDILLDPVFLLFLAIGLLLYLLAVKKEAMSTLFSGLKQTLKLFIALAFIAIAFILAAQILQGISKATKISEASIIRIDLQESIDASIFENNVLAKVSDEEDKTFLKEKVFTKSNFSDAYTLREGITSGQKEKARDILKEAGLNEYYRVDEEKADYWNNYSFLGEVSTGGVLVTILINLVLLLVPLIGIYLLSQLLGKKAFLGGLFGKIPVKWLVVLPLVLIGLAILIQPQTYNADHFLVVCAFSILAILLYFLVESQHPVAQGICKLAVSFFLYPFRYFKKITAYAKQESEVTNNENAAIDYFCYYTKGAICVGILLGWFVLAMIPLLLFYNLLPVIWESEILRYILDAVKPFLVGNVVVLYLLFYPVVFFILMPFYTVLITIFYELIITILQIFVKINKYFTKLLAKN